MSEHKPTQGRLILVTLLLFGVTATNVSAQHLKYAKGEVIVYFRPDVLNQDVLRGSRRPFTLSDGIFHRPDVRDAFERRFGAVGFTRISRVDPSEWRTNGNTGKLVNLEPFSRLLRVTVPDETDIDQLVTWLNAQDGVVFAEPNYRISPEGKGTMLLPATRSPASSPNDPEYSSQKSLEQATDVDIDIESAWQVTVGNPAVRVCVIDKGIDYDHPDLGNGSFGTGAVVVGGYDYGNDDADPDEKLDFLPGVLQDAHGTPVSGIIGARRNNNVGIAGIAGGDVSIGQAGVSLYALKILKEEDTTVGWNLELDYASQLAAMADAVGEYECDVVNMSLGDSDYKEGERLALSLMVESGIITVVARGNTGNTSAIYPASLQDDWLLVVGAYDNTSHRKAASGYGDTIDFLAPGDPSMIWTTGPLESAAYQQFMNTSAATPHVSGIAALLLSYSSSIGKSLHFNDVEGLLRFSADKTTYNYTPNGWNQEAGYGFVNAGRAITFLQAPYTFEQFTTVGGIDQGVTDDDFITVSGASQLGLGEGHDYRFKRHPVHKTITFSEKDEIFVWGRGVGASVGWSADKRNDRLYASGFAELVPGTLTSTSATLRTYVYQVYDINLIGQEVYLGYYPTTPANVQIAYSIVSTPVAPPPPPPTLSVYISGPVEAGWKDPFTLVSHPSGGIGQYAYHWYYRGGGSGSWNSAQNFSSTLNNLMLWTSGVEYKVEVTSGTQTASSMHFIDYCSGGCEAAKRDPDESTDLATPYTFQLFDAYPNPFNPTTSIEFELATASVVRLSILDVNGHEITRLVDDQLTAAGDHHETWDGSACPSGMYFFVLRAGEFVSSKSMLLVK